MTFSIEQIGGGNISNGDEGDKFRRFLSKIAPEDNASAELELKKHFTKADFSMMRVVGQFNKGFIIAHLQEDLFIGKNYGLIFFCKYTISPVRLKQYVLTVMYNINNCLILSGSARLGRKV